MKLRASLVSSGVLALLAYASSGCARVPSPLAPALQGSIGVPHRGVLTASVDLPRKGDGYRWLRDNDRHFATARFAHAIERAAAAVSTARPGGMLVVGDLSIQRGGQLLPHLSHRTGRDADLLLYVTSLGGAPVESPGFVHVGADGLAWDEAHKRFLRFDVERQWLLVKALVEDDDARIQWLFASRVVEAMLIEWALARGEPGETILRAQAIMLQPDPGGVHDDHMHVRTACTRTEMASGCEPTGPVRPWLDAIDATVEPAPTNEELVILIARPLEQPDSRSTTGPVSAR